jgi:hypothetical protein
MVLHKSGVIIAALTFFLWHYLPNLVASKTKKTDIYGIRY